MKNKRLAILLSAAMTFTSLQTGEALVYAEDFFAEDFISVDSFTDEILENDTEMDAVSNLAEDSFSSEVDETEEFYSDAEAEETTNTLLTENSETDIVINEDNFPDEAFRKYVAENFDIDQDEVLSCAEVDAITEIDVFGKNVSDLKGIEYFTNLESLGLDVSGVKSLDLSHNTALIDLSCYDSKLESLDVSNNINLEYLYCAGNEFSELDLRNNTKLKELDCSSLNLAKLDVSNMSMLELLNCGYNDLQELDVSNNHELTYLDCNDNHITELNLRNNNKIIRLECYNNFLEELDVHNLAGLETFRCDFNSLSVLDVSNNPKLEILNCSYNKLKTLDLTYNTQIKDLECGENHLVTLNLENQPLLGCDKNWTSVIVKYVQRFDPYVKGNNVSGFSLDLRGVLGSESISKIKSIGSTTKLSGAESDEDTMDTSYVEIQNGVLKWPYEYKARHIYLLLDTGYMGTYYKDVNLRIALNLEYEGNLIPVMEDENFVYENNNDDTVAIIEYKGREKDIVVPETFAGKRVTQIRAGENMGAYGVFARKDITSVTMPSIDLIGAYTFNKCSNLKTVYMPKVKALGSSAFAESGIVSVDAPLLTGIPSYGFSNCLNLITVNMPELTQISQYGFYGCKNLKEFFSSKKITTLTYGALSDTGLTSIRLYGNVDIGEKAVGYCKDESGNNVPIAGFKIYGEKGTTVEEYAKSNSLEFAELSSLPAICEHQWEEITEPATCSKEGLTYRRCKLCGEKDTGSEKVLPKIEHKTFVKNEKAATCTEKGYAGDKICAICGNVIEAGKEIPATGHKISVNNEKIATCTEKGYTGDKICDVCGTVVEAGKEIPTTGHKTSSKNEKSVTCTEMGYTGDKICDVCGTVVEAGKEIPAIGHKTSVKNQKTATCTEKGYTGDKICDVCGATVEKGKEIPVAGHKYSDYKVTKAATIFETGTETRECSVCKAQDSREIPKLVSSVTLITTSLPVQVKKSVSASALIANMESGDSIASLKTSNAKVAAVNNSTFKITAKKAGKATITVTLKSGASANITVNVKKGKVAATKITGIKKTVTLKKGKKLTLKPVLSPITCTEKVTYTSSNKKVATVSAKGVVKALKKGKATIKVKAGKKTVTCKVTVK